MWRCTYLIIIFSILTALAPRLAEAEITFKEKIFSIRRSVNDNELVYEVQMTPEGFHQADPINIFWIMNTKAGAIEPLTYLEKKRAYGIVIETVSKDKIQFSLKALPKRSLTISRENGTAMTTLLINGEEARIESIFIKTSPGGPIPPVEYIEVTGKSKSTGKSLTERISAKKKKH